MQPCIYVCRSSDGKELRRLRGEGDYPWHTRWSSNGKAVTWSRDKKGEKELALDLQRMEFVLPGKVSDESQHKLDDVQIKVVDHQLVIYRRGTEVAKVKVGKYVAMPRFAVVSPDRALIEGLSGQGQGQSQVARSPIDKAVYLTDLTQYVYHRVQELSDREQTPVSAIPSSVRPFALSQPAAE